MTLETRNRDRAVLRLLWNRPLTIAELTVALRGVDEIPKGWTTANVGAVVRRLHRDGKLCRLSFPMVTRSVIWWA